MWKGERDMNNQDVIYSINGPVVTVKNSDTFSMQEMVYVGHARLMSEVISISKEKTVIQVYESTTGLRPGEPVYPTGQPISVTLGPGILRNILEDAFQHPQTLGLFEAPNTVLPLLVLESLLERRDSLCHRWHLAHPDIDNDY